MKTTTSRFGIARGHHKNAKAQFKFWVLGLVTLAEGLVTVISFGFITAEWRAMLLFSAWMDD